ncbi:uncharacterized protein [Antedon mediterranea]|uniref:uncharacterized protein n=1 Tax=Antedon mediterranea TaxID=105859 RepID=UPI003AF924E8
MNGGECMDEGGGNYTCDCSNTNYYGDDCETFNPCSGAACMNGGTCNDLGNGNFTCNCTDVYEGATCGTYNPCLLEPCVNGECYILVNIATCNCTGTGYDGTACEQDVEDPLLICPGPFSYNTPLGEANFTLEDFSVNVTVSDNSGETLSTTSDFPADGVFVIGKTKITYEAQDSTGNMESCCVVVTIYDMESPDITCPSSDTVTTDDGLPGAEYNYTVLVEDNSNEVIPPVCSLLSGSLFPIGEILVMCNATDSSNNTAYCNFTITVEVNPCSGAACMNGGTCNDLGNGNFTCNCTDVYEGATCETYNPCLLEPCENGECYILMHVATCNCTGTGYDGTACEQDVEDPKLICPGPYSYNTPLEEANITLEDFAVNVTVSDNSGETLSTTSDFPANGVFVIGETKITYEAQDSTGNMESCCVVVTIYVNPCSGATCMNGGTCTDLGNGNFTCNCTSVYEGGTCETLFLQYDNNCTSIYEGATCETYNPCLLEPCVNGECYILMNVATCDCTGTGYDGTACEQDVEDPELICPGPYSYNTPLGEANITLEDFAVNVTVSDNSGETLSTTSDFPANGVFVIGETKITYEAQDSTGNMESCCVVVTIYDPILDIAGYSDRPQVITQASVIYGYTLGDDRTTDITIGILNDERGLKNITWNTTSLDGNVFPADTRFGRDERMAPVVLNRLQVIIDSTKIPNQVGVFSIEAKLRGVCTRTAIVIIRKAANINILRKTITVSVGDSVTIQAESSAQVDGLKWRRNYGNVIWNNTLSINIENIRAQDGGVYECFQGNAPDGNNGITRLIVRDCPSPKWNPPACEMDCPVCYNGGVCDDKTGLCICTPGFQGTQCETACGYSLWGRGCGIRCSISYIHSCRGKLVCPPDPVGCSCTAGYQGLDCSEDCPAGFYGSGCNMKCNCDNCDKTTGCNSTSSCFEGYEGPQCQAILSTKPCPMGYFGELCNYPCHCNNSDTCNRDDGSCDNGCDEAWAGPNCSIALPYLREPPRVIKQIATSISFDVNWIYGEDYGTGIITEHQLWYRLSKDSKWSVVYSRNTNIVNLTGLELNDNIVFYARHSRNVYNTESTGPSSPHGITQTVCSEPMISPNVLFTSVSGNEIGINIQVADDSIENIQCDDIILYQAQVKLPNAEINISNETDSEISLNFQNLSECIEYSFKARLVNNEHFIGPWSEAYKQITAPSDVKLQEHTVEELSIIIPWGESRCSKEVEDKIMYHYSLSTENENHQIGTTEETQLLFDNDIQPCTTYTFEVSASFENITGPADKTKMTTLTAFPGIPTITKTSSTHLSITLEWSPSSINSCKVELYNISITSDNTEEMFKTTTAQNIEIQDDVLPNTIYLVKVAAMTLKGYGNFSEETSITTLESPNTGLGVIIGSVTGSVACLIAILITIVLIKKRKYQLCARFYQEATAKDIELISNQKPNRKVATVEETERTVHNDIVISNNDIYLEPTIPSNRSPEVINQTIDDSDNFYEELGNYNPLHLPKTTKSTATKIESIYYNEPNLEPSNKSLLGIAIHDLPSYVLSKNVDPINGFEKDFENLGDQQLHKWIEAKSSVNKAKNRCDDIIPYDHSRVILHSVEIVTGSDYINASYLDGIERPNKFIACQEPNLASANDMWRMVWQGNSTVIVMVTNVLEGIKKESEKYWPEFSHVNLYGKIIVTNAEEQEHKHYVIRKFQVQMAGCEEIRSVWHYHFISWPDKSVPSEVTHLVDFIHKFKDEQKKAPPNTGPVIVHCSTGAGRTGTIISIFAMLDMAKHEGSVDVFNFVRSMRDKRILMVETKEQYIFIYEVLLEMLFCGQTTIPAMELGYALRNLTTNGVNEESIISQQFTTLQSMTPNTKGEFVSNGKDKMYMGLPEYLELVGYPRRLNRSTDGYYLGITSICDLYNRSKAFVTAQSPISDSVNTYADFWNMVFDYESQIIVSLNELEDKSYANFIPENINEQLECGEYIVTLKSFERKDEAIVQQTLELQKGKTKQQIFRLVYTQWQVNSSVPDMDSFLSLISSVERRQQSCKRFPAVIVCQDGAMCCGLYCAVSSIIQKIKEETLVDVYHTVKTLRKSCPYMVDNMEQYKFCYDAAASWLVRKITKI